MPKPYYAMPIPDYSLNQYDDNLAVIREIKYDPKTNDATLRLFKGFTVGTIFIVVGDCEKRRYKIWCNSPKAVNEYIIRKEDNSAFDAYDQYLLKVGKRIVKVGYFYDRK